MGIQKYYVCFQLKPLGRWEWTDEFGVTQTDPVAALLLNKLTTEDLPRQDRINIYQNYNPSRTYLQIENMCQKSTLKGTHIYKNDNICLLQLFEINSFCHQTFCPMINGCVNFCLLLD